MVIEKNPIIWVKCFGSVYMYVQSRIILFRYKQAITALHCVKS